jgi:hypothetical protein
MQNAPFLNSVQFSTPNQQSSITWLLKPIPLMQSQSARLLSFHLKGQLFALHSRLSVLGLLRVD